MTTLIVDEDWCEPPEIDISVIDDITRILMTPESADTQVGNYRRQRHTIVTLARLSVAASDEQLAAVITYLTRCDPAIAIYGILEFMRRDMRRFCVTLWGAMRPFIRMYGQAIIENYQAIRTVDRMQRDRDNS